MARYNTAALELDVDGRTLVFEMRGDLDPSEEVERTFLLSQRGQYLSEAFDQFTNDEGEIVAPEDAEITGTRRQGYHVDGGAGSHAWILSFTVSFEPELRWGDGTTDPDNADEYTRYDAQGAAPQVKKQLLGHWLAQARTDSGGQATLRWGEYSEGGIFEPVPVVIVEASLSSPEDDPAEFEGSMTLRRTDTFGSVEDALSGASESLENVLSEF